MSGPPPRIPNDASHANPPTILIILAVAAGLGWFWAFSLLATRYHMVLDYGVISSAPAAWGFLALPVWKLLLALCIASALTAGCIWQARVSPSVSSRPLCWLFAVYTIPVLDLLRCGGAPIEVTFLEPLLISFLTGAAVKEFAQHPLWIRGDIGLPRQSYCLAAVCLLTVGAVVWWYWQGQRAFDDYLLGYHDFGHFARRVVNTWEGRGFLLETPSLPAFWDHFNPGLALLAPLWAVWPDARVFILLQAACLAAPALLVYGIARIWGPNPLAATAWAAAYLALPAVGHLNLNYSYGWHPVSLALPLVFASVWALLRNRKISAAVFALLACAFKETVFVTLAFLAAALALQAWLTGRRNGVKEVSNSQASLLSTRLSPWDWVAVWAVLSISFVLVYKLCPFSEFQTNRFSNLGGSAGEIVLSPVSRPGAFWGQIFRLESAWFLLALLVPLGLRNVMRGGPILLAAAVPIGVLLAWQHGAATSISFQYVTTLLPVFVLAAISGAAKTADRSDRQPTAQGRSDSRTFLAAGVSALGASLIASTFFGALPWSCPTLTMMATHSHQTDSELSPENPIAVGTVSGAELDDVVAMVGGKEASVLASGRIAAHLLGVRRLEAVEQAIVRWEALCEEAGEGRSGVEVFDWIVLDTNEQFQQSSEKMQFFIREAERAGFHVERSRDGVVVFAKPGG